MTILNWHMVDRYCAQCGKFFMVWPAIIARGEGKYCSRECTVAGRWASYQYPYDATFLDSESELRSYFLGLFVADGHLGRNGQLCISLVDKQIIYDLAKRINFTGKIGFRPAKGNRQAKHILSLFGPAPRLLAQHGYPRGVKTGKEFIPESLISETTMHHFVRGLSDGDGCFFVDKSQNTLGWSVISASMQLIYDLRIYLTAIGVIVGGHVECRKKKRLPLWVLSTRHHDAISVGKYMYNEATIKLARKYELHRKLCTRKVYHVLQQGKTCSVAGCDLPCRCKNLCARHYSVEFSKKPERKAYMKKYLVAYYLKNREKLIARTAAYRRAKSS